jgi:uncharacterized protein
MMNQQQLIPSNASGRIQLIDIFRGFALLGIFVVNIRFMSSSVLYPEHFDWMTEGKANSVAQFILKQFFNGKFFPIFSFLFGVGFGMQMNKMEEKGKFSILFFIRRYIILLLFGLIHIIFIWGGDVLALYAIAGMLILLIRRIKVLYIVILAIGILLFPFYAHLLNYADRLFVRMGFESIIALKDYSFQDIMNIKMHGSFIENLRFRLLDYTVYYRNPEYFPILISMIFLGYSAGRIKFYNRIPEFLKKLKPFIIPTLIIIISFRIFNDLFQHYNSSFAWYELITKLSKISNVLQAFLYLYIIGLLYTNNYFKIILEPLAYAGRMSLTNYFMQSIFGVFLFHGLCFGLFGQLGLAWLGTIALIVFLLLLLASKIWLKYYRFGPLEWIWRQLTYMTKF